MSDWIFIECITAQNSDSDFCVKGQDFRPVED